MINRYFALQCTEDHGEHECDGIMFTFVNHGRDPAIPIFTSEALAQIAATEVHGVEHDIPVPKVIEIEIKILSK